MGHLNARGQWYYLNLNWPILFECGWWRRHHQKWDDLDCSLEYFRYFAEKEIDFFFRKERFIWRWAALGVLNQILPTCPDPLCSIPGTEGVRFMMKVCKRWNCKLVSFFSYANISKFIFLIYFHIGIDRLVYIRAWTGTRGYPGRVLFGGYPGTFLLPDTRQIKIK